MAFPHCMLLILCYFSNCVVVIALAGTQSRERESRSPSPRLDTSITALAISRASRPHRTPPLSLSYYGAIL